MVGSASESQQFSARYHKSAYETAGGRLQEAVKGAMIVENEYYLICSYSLRYITGSRASVAALSTVLRTTILLYGNIQFSST
jgi:hypothetical protein